MLEKGIDTSRWIQTIADLIFYKWLTVNDLQVFLLNTFYSILLMCNSLMNKQSHLPQNAQKSLAINDLRIDFYNSINEIPESDFAHSNIFLQIDYLTVLAQNPPLGYKFCYLVFYKNNQQIGFSACQIKQFRAAESLNFNPQQSSILLAFKKGLASQVNFNTLIVGSLLLTGENSYSFDNQLVTIEEKNQLITEGVKLAKKILAGEGISIQSVFIKDFFDAQEHLVTEGYNEFQVEPNFILEIPESWKNFDDYLDALSSKYRVRAKRAFKKLGGVEKKDFNVERIRANQLEINNLYQQIRQKSAFNLLDLHDNYFLELKEKLGERFHLFGYFLNGKLIGFYTTIENDDELEAHFLGYEESLNHEHQIYLNFLFDIIKNGIEYQSPKIIFARTAHEIKSSVGASARDMYLYMKHDNRIYNALLPYFLRILSPKENWLPRKPFKWVRN